MNRSFAALAALFILPGIASAQDPATPVSREAEAPATHEVSRGETLWELAQRYYQNPYLWPRIYEANRNVVEDPHWIYPGEELVIPDAGATVQVVAVTPEEAAEERPAAPPTQRAPVVRAEGRTVFFGEGEGGPDYVSVEESRTAPAVPREVVYSAPWLLLDGDASPSMGRVGGRVGAEETRRRTFFTYDRIRVHTRGPAPPTGTLLQSYRLERELEGVGEIAIPTGVLAVSEPTAAGFVALVVDEFDRVVPGDRVRPLPSYDPRPGVTPGDVAGGEVASVLGYAEDQAIQGLYDVAFLDRGVEAGVQVGDEYVLLDSGEAAWPATVEGRLQVVLAGSGFASVRILDLNNPLFDAGLPVILSRKMP